MIELTTFSGAKILIPISSIIYIEEVSSTLATDSSCKLTIHSLDMWREHYSPASILNNTPSNLEYIHIQDSYTELVFLLSSQIGINHQRISTSNKTRGA